MECLGVGGMVLRVPWCAYDSAAENVLIIIKCRLWRRRMRRRRSGREQRARSRKKREKMSKDQIKRRNGTFLLMRRI